MRCGRRGSWRAEWCLSWLAAGVGVDLVMLATRKSAALQTDDEATWYGEEALRSCTQRLPIVSG